MKLMPILAFGTAILLAGGAALTNQDVLNIAGADRYGASEPKCHAAETALSILAAHSREPETAAGCASAAATPRGSMATVDPMTEPPVDGATVAFLKAGLEHFLNQR